MNNGMNNIKQMGSLIKSMKNPQQAMIQMLMGNNNPMAKNVLGMIQNGDYQGVENFARNVCKEQGKDYDTEIANFRDELGL